MSLSGELFWSARKKKPKTGYKKNTANALWLHTPESVLKIPREDAFGRGVITRAGRNRMIRKTIIRPYAYGQIWTVWIV
jgi:hypothetical protein